MMLWMIRRIYALPALCILVAGCGSESTGQMNAAFGCVLNATRPCYCEDGTFGALVCVDGLSFSQCQCAGPGNIATAGTGGFGGAAGSAESVGVTGEAAAAGEAGAGVIYGNL